MPEKKITPRPDWLKITLRTNENFRRVKRLISDLSLHTVCEEARCPNIFECFANSSATFMILGEVCTRHCGFCSVAKGSPGPVDPREPENLAEAVECLGLDYVVVTSVDRDDLPDQGSRHFAATIRAIRAQVPRCRIEVLIPNFGGRRELLLNVLFASPDVLAHNIETVPELYKRVRPGSVYEESLRLLEEAAVYRTENSGAPKVKSGIMLGLGETIGQVLATMRDIRNAGCEILTIGQYLSPKKRSLQVKRYYLPEEFSYLRDEGLKLGFAHVESGPLVRSSYHARRCFESCQGVLSNRDGS